MVEIKVSVFRWVVSGADSSVALSPVTQGHIAK